MVDLLALSRAADEVNRKAQSDAERKVVCLMAALAKMQPVIDAAREQSRCCLAINSEKHFTLERQVAEKAWVQACHDTEAAYRAMHAEEEAENDEAP